MLEKLPPEVQQAIWGLGALIPTAWLARLLWHNRLVRLGQRRFWGPELWWEIPTAVFCAVMGGGIASYFGLDHMASNAVVGVVGWLGPRGVEVALGRLIARYSPESKGKRESR